MTTSIQSVPSSNARANFMTAAGILIILLGAGAALLPFVDRLSGNRVVGVLLLAAGVVEIAAGTQRVQNKFLAMLAGAVTTLAGLLFVANPVAHFLPTITIVTVWLIARSVILAVTSGRAHGSVRIWLGIAAATDFALGVLLLIGLSIATAIVMLFGPTPTLVASFAWLFAISFAVTGGLLLEIASCFRNTEIG
ncbi:MAG TPA: DUF308 domain-containing protein [Sphingomicrobium sp.]|nr:DUF308 domain-containing protein [Sphingomicrobium sp.]